MKKFRYIAVLALGAALTSCQDKDVEISTPVLAPVSSEDLKGELSDNDYVWTWTPREGVSMQITVLRDGQILTTETSSTGRYSHRNVETKIPYSYIFKLTDGNNFSTGVIKSFTRQGASSVSGISMTQIEKPDATYDAYVEWTPSDDATQLQLTANSGSRSVTETLPGSASSYTIENVMDGDEWTVSIVADNADGKSLPASGTLKIGKTAIGFLSEYPTPEELVANGDDDEACAWLWLKEEYPSAQYIYFGDISSSKYLSPYRVLFWLRDLEDRSEDDVFNMPSTVNEATPYVREWYADGGNMLLWSHATAYVGTLGRLQTDMLRSNDHAIGLGRGGWNGDTWMMAVQLHPGSRFKKDASTHPIFKGMDVITNDRTKLIAFKGAGWTEDHNCLYFNLPSVLTGLGNQDEACYNAITETYGIIPLGTWDSQIDWVSQLNVWEARQGNTEFRGTIICVGNGGCEFSLKNADGTPDISAYPKNNPYQENVLRLAKNSLEYLKTR